MAQVLASHEYAAGQALVSGGQLHEAVAKFESARANFCEGDSVTMDQIKKAIQRVLTRFSLNPYLCLGVEAAVEVGAAKKKYRKLILKYHPDKNPLTTSLFRAIQQAFEVISEPSKRREIDRQLARQSAAPRPGGGTRQRRASTTAAGASSGGYAAYYARYHQQNKPKAPPGGSAHRRHSNFGPGGSAYGRRPPPPPSGVPPPGATRPSQHQAHHRPKRTKSRWEGKGAWHKHEVPQHHGGGHPPGGGARAGGSRVPPKRHASFSTGGGNNNKSSQQQRSGRAGTSARGAYSARNSTPNDYMAWAREYKRKMMEKKAQAEAAEAAANDRAGRSGSGRRTQRDHSAPPPGSARPPPPPPRPESARTSRATAHNHGSGAGAGAGGGGVGDDDAAAAADDFNWSGSSYSYKPPASSSSSSSSRPAPPSTSTPASRTAQRRARRASAPPPSSYAKSKPSQDAAYPPRNKIPPGRTPQPRIAAKSDSTATVDWEAPSKKPMYFGVYTKITAYEVAYRCRQPDLLPWSRAATKTIVPTSDHPSASITGLKPSTQYETRIRAGSAAGWGEWSEVAHFTTAPTLAAKQADMMKQAQETRARLKKVLEERHAREAAKARERIHQAKERVGASTPRGGSATPSGSSTPRGGEPNPSTPRDKTRFKGARRRASYVARKAAMEAAGGDPLKAEEMQARFNIKERTRQRMAEQQYGKSTPRGGHTRPGHATPRTTPSVEAQHSDIDVESPPHAAGTSGVDMAKRKRRHSRSRAKHKRDKGKSSGKASADRSPTTASKSSKSEDIRAAYSTPKPAAAPAVATGAGASGATDSSSGVAGKSSGGVMKGIKRWLRKKLKKTDEDVGKAGSAAHKPPPASKPMPSASYLRTPQSARTAARPSTPAPSKATSGGRSYSVEEGQAFWYEAYDETNRCYYYVHSITNESRWEAPLWMEYLDAGSGQSYYVNSYTSSSQWDCPSDFVPVARKDASGSWVTTPITEAQAAEKSA